MGFLKRSSPEEKAERQRVGQAVRLKALTTACGSAVLVYFALLVGFNSRFVAAWGIVPAGGTFIIVLIFSGAIFAYSENTESRKRLAAIAESKRQAEQETQRQQLEARARQEQERAFSLRQQAQQEFTQLDAQKKRDDREFMLKRLTNINNFIDLYDPETPDRAARVRQGIAKVLNEIIVKHNSSELQAMIAREPEVRGLFTTVTDRLKAKQIESAEANQILSAIG
jgi:hypothetical protein